MDIDETGDLVLDQTFVNFAKVDFTAEEKSPSNIIYKYEASNISANTFDNKLTVVYDVVEPNQPCGDIILRDGHFIHYIRKNRPTDEPATEDVASEPVKEIVRRRRDDGNLSIPRNIAISIDTSKSMKDAGRMDAAKRAVIKILEELSPHDTFWLQSFSNTLLTYKRDPIEATPENVQDAIKWVNGLQADGGTNLNGGLQGLIKQPHDDKKANLAFVISDGMPTTGESNWSNIQVHFRSYILLPVSHHFYMNIKANTLKNNADGDSDGQKWGIYSFAIGDRAPISELDKLSHQNMGTSTQVGDNEDVSGVLTDFFRDFSSPILWNYDIAYKGVTDYDCSDSNLFFDQELVCIGKISHKPCDKPKIEEPNEDKVGFLMANPDMLKVILSLEAHHSSRAPSYVQ